MVAALTRAQPPLIGLTTDHETRPKGGSEAEYVLRSNYSSVIAQAGGMPVLLPYDTQDVAALLDRIDGIVITGGMFDIPPQYYGHPADPGLTLKRHRTDFERALIAEALRRDLPVLGICNGMQLLAVCCGGTLEADILRDVPGGLEHRPHDPPTAVAHRIEFLSPSLFDQITHGRDAWVNSLHHQAVREADGYFVAARCVDDGIIEAIEVPGKRFAFGVQWHPEYQLGALDGAIIQAFVNAAGERKS